MSEENMDSLDRADEEKDEDVEAHGFTAPVDGAPHATEEPPDVEGHGFTKAPVDPRPMDP
jgi:hypothetical protein